MFIFVFSYLFPSSPSLGMKGDQRDIFYIYCGGQEQRRMDDLKNRGNIGKKKEKREIWGYSQSMLVRSTMGILPR